MAPFAAKLTAEEREALSAFESGRGKSAAIDDFLRLSYPRLRSLIEEEFQSADLDTALEILESDNDEHASLKALLWRDDEELTEWGESFLCWSEGSGDPAGLSSETFQQYLEHLEPVYRHPEGEQEQEQEQEQEPEIEAEPKPQTKSEGEVISFVSAPMSPFEKQNQLIVKNKYLGYGKNSEGVIGLCGQITISYFEEKELVGRIESSNPLLFTLPNRLSGNTTTVTYWLPPIAFPHPAGHLSIRTPEETKTLALHALFPKSRTDYLRDRQVILVLLSPALLGFLYFGFVYFVTAKGLDREAAQLFPELYGAALEGLDSVDFRSQGLGLYRLRIVPASESLQMIWAGVLLLAPLISSKFFIYLSSSRRRRFSGLLALVLLLPSLCLLLTWGGQGSVYPLYDHQDFAPLDLRGFLTWGIPVNVLVAGYLFLSAIGFWDRKIPSREFRMALPFVLTILYLVGMFFLIYGRSWLG